MSPFMCVTCNEPFYVCVMCMCVCVCVCREFLIERLCDMMKRQARLRHVDVNGGILGGSRSAGLEMEIIYISVCVCVCV